ncbi:ABC transporter permease [Nocardia terpenica]|uniref:ABC transporter permease n=1 Tax=Nocardia terpenica TaxID=455432 RepID=A0A6G9ZAN5_9NOCA|nr:ABC transporter permease [Nocardia terpenica]QIS22470.1 ABC transporter permease [Nocardia terpenica]
MIIPSVPADIARSATSEVRKITTLRSGRVLVPLCAAVGLVAAAATAAVGSGPQQGATPATGTASIGLYLALAVAISAAAVFGALGSGDEFRTDSISLTALFAPDRDLLFGTKLAVTAAYSLLLGLVAEVGALVVLLGLARHETEFGLRLTGVLGGGLVAALCWGVIGASLGLLVRSAVQAVATMIGWLAIAEPLIWLIAKGIGVPGVAVLLPGSATIGTVMVGSFPGSAFLAPSAASIIVLLLWTAGAGAASWWSLHRREL